MTLSLLVCFRRRRRRFGASDIPTPSDVTLRAAGAWRGVKRANEKLNLDG